MAHMGECGSLASMELDVRPDPPEDVRAALAAALDDDADGAPTSPWWRAGIEESVGDAGAFGTD